MVTVTPAAASRAARPLPAGPVRPRTPTCTAPHGHTDPRPPPPPAGSRGRPGLGGRDGRGPGGAEGTQQRTGAGAAHGQTGADAVEQIVAAVPLVGHGHSPP